jgi:hypothetical protein
MAHPTPARVLKTMKALRMVALAVAGLAVSSLGCARGITPQAIISPGTAKQSYSIQIDRAYVYPDASGTTHLLLVDDGSTRGGAKSSAKPGAPLQAGDEDLLRHTIHVMAYWPEARGIARRIDNANLDWYVTPVGGDGPVLLHYSGRARVTVEPYKDGVAGSVIVRVGDSNLKLQSFDASAGTTLGDVKLTATAVAVPNETAYRAELATIRQARAATASNTEAPTPDGPPARTTPQP